MEREEKAGRAVPAYMAQIKTLRSRRGPTSPQQTEQSRIQRRTQQAVLKALAAQPMTVPEIATETGLSTQDVFWWIAALRKYNQVVENGKRGEYTMYRRTGDAGSPARDPNADSHDSEGSK